jgi:hypothetical protein
MAAPTWRSSRWSRTTSFAGAASAIGTELFFELVPGKKCTVLRFSHRRWLEATDFLRFCSVRWAIYLVSLKNLLETGKGMPWPREVGS